MSATSEIEELNNMYNEDIHKLEQLQLYERNRNTTECEEKMKSIENQIDELNKRREEHIHFVNDTRTRSVQQQQLLGSDMSTMFRILPCDTIIYILKFYELPVLRHWYTFVNEYNRLISRELIKLLFGYFPLHDYQRTPHTIFTSVKLYYQYSTKKMLHSDAMSDLRYNIVHTKSIVSLNVRNHSDIKNEQSGLMNLDHLEKMNIHYLAPEQIDPYLDACKNVNDVTLLNFRQTPTGTMSHLSNVTKWKCNDWRLDYNEIGVVLSHCINLTYLYLNKFLDGQALNIIAGLPKLTKLRMPVNVSQFKLNPNLRELHLSVGRVIKLDYCTTVDIMKLEHLHSLTLYGYRHLHEESFPLFATLTVPKLFIRYDSLYMSHIFQNKTIRHLDIYGEEVNEILSMDRHMFWSQLLSLGLCGAQHDNTTPCIDIITSNAKNLTSLHISYSGITTDSLKRICTELPHLHTLKIDECDNVDDSNHMDDGLVYAFMN
jgi:hypothetical protein